MSTGLTLKLVLTNHWYDETAAGRKRVEYRTMTEADGKPSRWYGQIWLKRHERGLQTLRSTVLGCPDQNENSHLQNMPADEAMTNPPQPPLGATPEPSASDRALADTIIQRHDLGLTARRISEIEEELAQLIAAHVAQQLSTARAALAQCQERSYLREFMATKSQLEVCEEKLADAIASRREYDTLRMRAIESAQRSETRAGSAESALSLLTEKLAKAEASNAELILWKHNAVFELAAHAKELEDSALIDWFERSHRGVTAYEQSGLFGTKRLWRIDGVPDAGRFQPTFRDALREAKIKYDKRIAATTGKEGAS